MTRVRTIDGVDSTTQALLFALLGAVLGAGVVLAWRVSERADAPAGRRSRSPRCPPASPPCSACCAPARWSSTRRTRCVKASAPAYAFGLVRGNEVAVDELADLVRQVRRDGQIRETELVLSRGRAGRSAARHRPRRSAEQPAGARPGRGPHPRAPGRGDPPRLRRQRLPRAEDPGRRAEPAGRGGAGGRRRPGGGDPVRRPDADRERPADPAGAADHRAVPAAGRRPARRPADRSTSTRSSPGPSTRAPSTPRPRTSSVVHDGERGLQILGNGDEVALALGNLVANAVAYSPDDSRVVVAARADDMMVDLTVTDQGIGIPAARDRPDLRAVLPRRPGPAPLHRRHRPRPVDRQARRRLARRRGAGLVGRGPGLHVHALAAPPASTRRAPPRPPRPTPEPSTDAPANRRQPRDPSARRRGRGELQRRARLHAAQGGLRGLGGRHRAGRARRVRPDRRRHRAARPDAARACPAPRCAGRSGRPPTCR